MFAVVVQVVFLASAGVAAKLTPEYSPINNYHDAAPHSAPFIVSIQSNRSEHYCAGAIINASWVLTSANCVFRQFGSVVAGLYDLAANESATVQRRAFDLQSVFPHHKYPDVPIIPIFDIGLIQVQPPFVFTASVQPIALPPAKSIPRGKVQLFGWPRTTQSPSPNRNLQVANLRIWSNGSCFPTSGDDSSMQTLCVGPFTADGASCFDASGGPLFQDSQLVGIETLSFSLCEGNGKPSDFARTSAFLDWIRSFLD